MADTGKKPAPDSGVATTDTSTTAGGALTSEPTGKVTEESSGATILVKTAWPHSSFDMPDDDVPMITSDGTMLTKTQLAVVEKSALANGVGLEIHAKGAN